MRLHTAQSVSPTGTAVRASANGDTFIWTRGKPPTRFTLSGLYYVEVGLFLAQDHHADWEPLDAEPRLALVAQVRAKIAAGVYGNEAIIQATEDRILKSL